MLISMLLSPIANYSLAMFIYIYMNYIYYKNQ
jgi:hypothetical protein